MIDTPTFHQVTILAFLRFVRHRMPPQVKQVMFFFPVVGGVVFGLAF